jgi:hypothetical protein
MPNWCNQSAVITANTKKELEDFIAFCSQTHLSQHKDWRTGEIAGEVGGIFWNFKSPEDLEAYFGEDSKEVAEDFMSQMAKDFAESDNWYYWNVRNWGTKWDLEPESLTEHEIEEENGVCSLVWNFSTAWSPAEPMYRIMSERFPELHFSYEITEEANFYAGKVSYKNGEELDAEWIDNPEHADFLALDIPCTICSWDDEEPCTRTTDEASLHLVL